MTACRVIVLRRCRACSLLHGPGECRIVDRPVDAAPEQPVTESGATPTPAAKPKTNAERQTAWRARHREKARELDRQRKRATKGATAWMSKS